MLGARVVRKKKEGLNYLVDLDLGDDHNPG